MHLDRNHVKGLIKCMKSWLLLGTFQGAQGLDVYSEVGPIDPDDIHDPLFYFVRECCELKPGADEDVKRLWTAYTTWCANNNIRPSTRGNLHKQLLIKYPIVKIIEPTKKGRNGKGFAPREIRFHDIRLNSIGNEYAGKENKKDDKL
jgi:hypothetical protein